MLKIDLEAKRTSYINEPVIKSIGKVTQFGSFTPENWKKTAWKRCVHGVNGTVYFQMGMSTSDGGVTIEKTDHILSEFDMLPETVYISEPGFFLDHQEIILVPFAEWA